MIDLKKIRDRCSVLRIGDNICKENIIINDMADWIEKACALLFICGIQISDVATIKCIANLTKDVKGE